MATAIAGGRALAVNARRVFDGLILAGALELWMSRHRCGTARER
jgi:hypothetical protein